MSAEEQTIDELIDFITDPDSVIDFTLREQCRLFKNSNDDKFKLSALTAMSVTATTVKRIKSDDKNSTADREIAQAIANNLSNIKGNPFLSKDNVTKQVTEPSLPSINIVPDGMAINTGIIELDEILI